MNIRLRELRKSQGKSAQQVALATGISKNGIHILETNPNNSPMIRTLVIPADYYGVSLDYLEGRTDNPEIALNKEVCEANDNPRPHGRWNFIGVDKARRRVYFERSECGTLFELEMFVAEEMSPKVIALLESGAATKDELLLLNGVNYNYCPNYCPSCGAKLDGSEEGGKHG